MAPRWSHIPLDRREPRRGGRRTMTDLTGRTAVVTGGGSGLGAAIASALHTAGADVVVVGRDQAKLDAVVERLGGRTRSLTCDVSDPASVDSLRSELDGTEVSIL